MQNVLYIFVAMLFLTDIYALIFFAFDKFCSIKLFERLDNYCFFVETHGIVQNPE